MTWTMTTADLRWPDPGQCPPCPASHLQPAGISVFFAGHFSFAHSKSLPPHVDVSGMQLVSDLQDPKHVVRCTLPATSGVPMQVCSHQELLTYGLEMTIRGYQRQTGGGSQTTMTVTHVAELSLAKPWNGFNLLHSTCCHNSA